MIFLSNGHLQQYDDERNYNRSITSFIYKLFQQRTRVGTILQYFDGHWLGGSATRKHRKPLMTAAREINYPEHGIQSQPRYRRIPLIRTSDKKVRSSIYVHKLFRHLREKKITQDKHVQQQFFGPEDISKVVHFT